MSNRRSITCDEVITFLADYLGGQLDPGKVREFERHLSECDSCVAYIASYQETIRLAKTSANPPTLRLEDVPNDLVAAILATVRHS